MQPTSNKSLERTVSNLQKKVTKMQEQLNQKQDKKITITLRPDRCKPLSLKRAKEIVNSIPCLSLPNKAA